jgi:hypothetical protein
MSDSDIAVKRSGFVTGLAWTFIALAGYSTLIGVLQNVMLGLMFPTEQLREIVRQTEGTRPMPAVFRFMFEHFRFFFLGFLLMSAATLVAAIGLLKRRNWARLVFIGIMALGVMWNLTSLAIPFFMTSFIPDVSMHPRSDFQDNFRLVWNIMTGFTVVMGLALAVLCGWIIKRLVSKEIESEFVAR